MSATCTCTSKYENSGYPSCSGAVIAASRRLIMVPKYTNAGVLNKITIPTTLNAAFFSGKINNSDRSVRWYPLPKHVNAEISKEASVYETFNDGSKNFIHEGVANFKALYAAKQPNYLNILKSGRCTEMGVFIVDKNGALIGNTNGESGVLYPLWISKNTTDAIMKWATDSTGLNIEFMFEFDADQYDENVHKIDASDMVSVNLLNGYDGLYDAAISYTSTGQTSMVFALTSKYGGSVATPVKIQGLLAADFALYNVTDSSAVTVATCTESPAGTYTLTYLSQTVADVIRVTPTLTGVDFTTVIATTSVVA